MAQDFDVRQFFRKASKECLKRYFEKHGCLLKFDWDTIGPRKIEPLFDAFNSLDEDLRLRMGQDFHNLDLIRTAGGTDNDDAGYRGMFDELCAEFDWPDSLWSDLDAACGGTLSNADKIGLLFVITEYSIGTAFSSHNGARDARNATKPS